MEQVILRPWGNSQGICIPKKILNQLGIQVSDTLQIDVTNDSIVLTKAFRHKTFEERLEEYDNQISVYPYEWGDPKGREIL